MFTLFCVRRFVCVLFERIASTSYNMVANFLVKLYIQLCMCFNIEQMARMSYMPLLWLQKYHTHTRTQTRSKTTTLIVKTTTNVSVPFNIYIFFGTKRIFPLQFGAFFQFVCFFSSSLFYFFFTLIHTVTTHTNTKTTKSIQNTVSVHVVLDVRFFQNTQETWRLAFSKSIRCYFERKSAIGRIHEHPL